MGEVWLRNNQRAFAVGMLPVAGCAATGLVLILAVWQGAATGWMAVLGWCLLVPSAVLFAVLLRQARRPRLAYAAGHLLVHLRAGEPLRVPLEVVECFLLGHGPSLLPVRASEELETATVVIRLSPKAAEWAGGPVEPRLGCWCESHMILRGTWCEPLNVDVVRRLNARLGEATRAWQKSQVSQRGSL